jgi:hypothetical protein
VSAHQEFTPAARRRLAFTASASGTHAEAAEVAAEWGLPVDDATMPAPVQSAGARAEEQTGRRLASPPPGREPARAPSELAVLMIDGCLLRFRGPGWGRTRPTQPRVEWHELKLGVFCREERWGSMRRSGMNWPGREPLAGGLPRFPRREERVGENIQMGHVFVYIPDHFS